MSGWLYAVIVVAFVVAGVVVVRVTQRGAFVDRLPLEADEDVLLEEAGLRLYHRARRKSVRGGATTTHRVRSVLTNRRILLATGGPQGEHKFVVLMILDFTTPAPVVDETGYAAYAKKFRLSNGYPTYSFTPEDASVTDGALDVVVPFAESGAVWGGAPEVKLYTAQAERYRETIAGAAEHRG